MSGGVISETELEPAGDAPGGGTAAASGPGTEGMLALIQGLDAIVWEMDVATWRFTFVSRRAEELLGYPVQRWLEEPGFWVDTLLHPDDREWAVDFCVTATRDSRDHAFEYRALASDGRILWLKDLVRVVRNERGEARRLQGVMVDITREKTLEAELGEQARHAALSTDVGLAISSPGPLRQVLQACAEAMVHHLGAAFARVWTLNEAEQVLELQASAGLYTHVDGPHGRVPVGAYKIGRIAQERIPHLTNDVPHDPLVSDREWARREGMVAFAGYPLLAGERLVGVAALFAREALTATTLEGLRSIADRLALVIENRWAAERARRFEEEQLARTLAEAERARLHRLLLQVPAAVAITRGPDHIFELVNPAFEALITRRTLLGRPLREGFPEPVSQGLADLMDSVYATGRPYVGSEVRVLWDRDGAGGLGEGFFNFVYQPLTDLEDAIQGIMIHAVEVTEQIHARRLVEDKAEELARLTRALEVSNRELDQFAYVASHDLKAPLRGIANLAQWLEEDLAGRLTDETRRHLELLRSRVHRMEALTDGILEYSRAGRTRSGVEAVDVRSLIDDVAELISGAAPSATIAIEGELPVLHTDRLQLQQVFMNLISNAVKHGARPDLRVGVSARDADDFVEFAVRDNGPGIEPRFHERVWGIFQTLESRDRVEGTGIGLALVRKLAESNGGRAWLESEPGAGATFRFLWPRRMGGD